MGITIYYFGKIRAMAELPSLVNEVTELCQHVGWEHEIIYRSFEIPVQGIAFAPKGSDPVWMTFLDNGTLLSPDGYEMIQQFELDLEKDCKVETKTHYAGVKNHMRVIKLIKYLGAKYFSDISMYDESRYWQTGSETICRREFEIMEKWVTQMISKLDELDGRIGDVGESGELVEERISALINKMPVLDVLNHLITSRPGMDEFTTLDN